jgi:lysyl-tRNA synthetase class 2
MSTPNYSNETLDRIKKLDRIRSLGVNPYATKFDTTHQIGHILQMYPSSIDPTLQHSNPPTFRPVEEVIATPKSTISIAGRVMLHRSFGKICFATISDGTGRIQVLFSRENCSIVVDSIRHAELGSVSSTYKNIEDPEMNSG